MKRCCVLVLAYSSALTPRCVNPAQEKAVAQGLQRCLGRERTKQASVRAAPRIDHRRPKLTQTPITHTTMSIAAPTGCRSKVSTSVVSPENKSCSSSVIIFNSFTVFVGPFAPRSGNEYRSDFAFQKILGLANSPLREEPDIVQGSMGSGKISAISPMRNNTIGRVSPAFGSYVDFRSTGTS